MSERTKVITTAAGYVIAHGRATSYLTHGCRCPECTAAHTEAKRGTSWVPEDRAAVLARMTAEHGPAVAAVILRDWERNTKATAQRKGDVRDRDVRHGWYTGKRGSRGAGVVKGRSASATPRRPRGKTRLR